MSKRRRNSSSSSISENCGDVSLDISFVDQTPSSPLALSQTSLVGLIQPERSSFNESSLKSFDIDVSDEQDQLVENIIIEQPDLGADCKEPLEGTGFDDNEDDNNENEGDCDLDFDDALSIDSQDDDLLSCDPKESSKPNQSDKPIYKDAPMTISESLLAVLSFSVRHNLDGKAIVDLLKLISLHLKEEDNQFKSTLYFFKKHFSHLKAPVKLHYFCSVCLSCLPTGDSICPNINSHKNKKTQCSYFLEISLEHQLQMLYKRKGILENILSRFSREKKHSQNIEDIYDGQIYKEFVESGFLSEKNKYNISLTWNSDGVPVFKSPKTSMWPIYFVINELPFKMRFKKSNVLLGGIWYGAKPSANMMLRPFISSLTTLRKGIEVKPFDISPETAILVQAILLAGTADLPAKAEFMGIKYPSGSHSCAVCKISGKSVKVKPTATLEKATKSPRGSADEDSPSEGEDDEPRKTKRGVLEKKERVASVWVFPYEEEAAALRRHNETEDFGNAVLPQREKNHSAHICGVKYPTFLTKMMPDMIRGMGIDDLHHAYHGVGHKLVELWTLPKYKKMPWSIQGKIAVLDERLQNIKLPNYIQCGVRTLSNLSLWKAQHMKVFILYLALPVLEGVLPTVYYNHFSIFVNCIYILNSSSISPDQLLFCTVQLKSFVKQFQDLYGE
ncbi:hypothetical protein FOCC_FOCC014353 [Frankliniella occidentalis]|nr:hypothetical protein FOCC_FOCC014353 [Frankliniella occidentalis]